MRGSEWAPLSPAAPDREGGLRDKTPRCSLPRGQEAWHQGDCRCITTTPTHRHKCLGGWEDTAGRSAVWPPSLLDTAEASTLGSSTRLCTSAAGPHPATPSWHAKCTVPVSQLPALPHPPLSLSQQMVATSFQVLKSHLLRSPSADSKTKNSQSHHRHRHARAVPPTPGPWGS